MVMRRWLVGVGVVILVSSMGIGCGKKEPVKPPPGVTKEMEQVAPPTIDLGSPTGGSETTTPTSSDTKTK
jgi:hypothetical protein